MKSKLWYFWPSSIIVNDERTGVLWSVGLILNSKKLLSGRFHVRVKSVVMVWKCKDSSKGSRLSFSKKYDEENLLPKMHTHTHTHTYIIYINDGRLKSCKPHQERRALAEHFCYSNAQPLLIKLEKPIQISVLISMQMSSPYKGEGFETK